MLMVKDAQLSVVSALYVTDSNTGANSHADTPLPCPLLRTLYVADPKTEMGHNYDDGMSTADAIFIVKLIAQRQRYGVPLNVVF